MIGTIVNACCILVGSIAGGTLKKMMSQRVSDALFCAMGLAGEIAWGHMAPYDGNATYRNRIIDAVCHLDGETLSKGARYELR